MGYLQHLEENGTVGKGIPCSYTLHGFYGALLQDTVLLTDDEG